MMTRAFHITKFANLDSIKSGGLLLAEMPSNYDHSGDGIYVFFGKKHAFDFAEYIDVAEGLCVTVEVDSSALLMDEDALLVTDDNDVEDLRLVMPEAAYLEYLEFLESRGGEDELPINDPDVARFKVGLIDKYRIQPNKRFLTSWGHYNVLTARVAAESLPVKRIEVFIDDESYKLSEFSPDELRQFVIGEIAEDQAENGF